MRNHKAAEKHAKRLMVMTATSGNEIKISARKVPFSINPCGVVSRFMSSVHTSVWYPEWRSIRARARDVWGPQTSFIWHHYLLYGTEHYRSVTMAVNLQLVSGNDPLLPSDATLPRCPVYGRRWNANNTRFYHTAISSVRSRSMNLFLFHATQGYKPPMYHMLWREPLLKRSYGLSCTPFRRSPEYLSAFPRLASLDRWILFYWSCR